MWKVTSVTSVRNSPRTASQTCASSALAPGVGSASGTGRRQPSGRLLGIRFLEARGGRKAACDHRGGGSLTPVSESSSVPPRPARAAARKSREKPPRRAGRRSLDSLCTGRGRGRFGSRGGSYTLVPHVEADLSAEEAQ